MLVCQFRHFPGLGNQCFRQDPPLFYQRFLPETTRPKVSEIHRLASPGTISLQGHKDALPWLIVDGTTDVAPTCGILGQHNITGAEPSHRSIAGLYLYFVLQCDDVLSSGSIVPVDASSSHRSP